MDAAQSAGGMDSDDLRPADEAILDVLRQGRATKGHLVDETGYSRNTVYNRLEVLEAAGHVETVHEGTRLFEFVDDPRDESEFTDSSILIADRAPGDDVHGVHDYLQLHVDDARGQIYIIEATADRRIRVAELEEESGE
ncbi:helix-turn-helix transcriptional regulator [Halobacteriaceae archaeon GCM10025711]